MPRIEKSKLDKHTSTAGYARSLPWPLSSRLLYFESVLMTFIQRFRFKLFLLTVALALAFLGVVATVQAKGGRGGGHSGSPTGHNHHTGHTRHIGGRHHGIAAGSHCLP